MKKEEQNKEEKKNIEALTEIVEGKMTVIASDDSIDRSGDSLSASDWNFKNFKNNPVLQAGHDYRPQFTIGIAKNIRVEGNKVLFEPEFHTITPLAKEIKEMYEQGFLKAWSVGFIPARKEGGKHELLEVSAVAVPANANALVVAKGMNSNEVEEIKSKITEFVKKEVEFTDEEKEKLASDAQPLEEVLAEDAAKEKAINPIGFKFTERWNKSLPEIFNRSFNITNAPSITNNPEHKLYTKYLGCEVKDLMVNHFDVPSPLLGTYLSAFKSILKKYDLVDERNYNPWSGSEIPLNSEVIKLNSTEEDDFLIEGVQYYGGDGKRFMVKYFPTFYGFATQIISDRKHKDWNKGLLKEVKDYAKENNKLKGEIFALSGEFLKKSEDSWDDLVLPEETESAVKKAINQLNKKGKDADKRGLMFIGVPGTGKTLTGRIMMNDLKDKTFIWISSKDFELAKNARMNALELGFKLAKDLAPAVLFIEDVDKWLEGTNIDLLKTEMDGLNKYKGLITILTSNEPEELPDALLDRPGRFHEILDFVPPTDKLRSKMLSKWVGDLEEKLLKEIIKETEGYSGAHMKELVDFANMIAEDDDMEIGKALIKSLEKLKRQRELIENIKKKKKPEKEPEHKSAEDIADIKAGRVISAKNKKVLNDAISASETAITALEKLLETSEEPETEPKKFNEPTPAKEKGDDKGREPRKAHKELTSSELAVHTLKAIAKQTSFALNRSNNKHK